MLFRSMVREWFSANRKASLLGGSVLAGLLVLMAAFLYRGRATKARATSVKRPLAQPKYERKVALDELSATRPARVPADASRFSEASQESAWSRAVSQPAFAPAAEVSASHAAVLSKPSIGSALVANSGSVSEEREVFEL